MENKTAYCDGCESIQNLSEDGYCLQCGKHYDNMPAGKERVLLYIDSLCQCEVCIDQRKNRSLYEEHDRLMGEE